MTRILGNYAEAASASSPKSSTPNARRWKFRAKVGRATSDPEKMVTPGVLYASKSEGRISVHLLAFGWWDWHVSFLAAHIRAARCRRQTPMTSPMTDSTPLEHMALAVKRYLAENTGFVSEYDDEGTMAAYYGGHWVTLDTNAIARAALDASGNDELVEAATETLNYLDRYNLMPKAKRDQLRAAIAPTQEPESRL